jgi:hypothetical protein
MIDMVTGFQLLRITELFYFSLIVIVIVDAITIKLISVAIQNEKPLCMLEDMLTFVLRYSLIFIWVIILIVLNVVVVAYTINDIYFSLANNIIEDGSFIKE